MASTAIPGILPARKMGKDFFVDGGIVNPTPVDAYPLTAYDHFLAIDFHFHAPNELDEMGFIDTMHRAVMIAPHQIFLQKIKRYKRKCTILHLAKENNMFGFYNSAQYIKEGEEAGEELIREWKLHGIYQSLKSKKINNTRH
jgi:predicted acylesterase/phospholipase RssA